MSECSADFLGKLHSATVLRVQAESRCAKPNVCEIEKYKILVKVSNILICDSRASTNSPICASHLIILT